MPSVGERVDQRDLLSAVGPDRDQLVEREHRDERDLRDHVVQLAPCDAQTLGHLLLGRLPLQHGLEVGVRLLDLAGLEADRTRHPVHGAELIDDGALDARDRVRLELVAAPGLELRQGVDQAEHAVAHEVGLLHARRQSGRDTARHVLHERGVVQDELLARLVIGGALEPVPVAPELVVDVGRDRDRRVERLRRLRLRLDFARAFTAVLAPDFATRLGRRLGGRLLHGGHDSGPRMSSARRPGTTEPATRGCSAAWWRRSRVPTVPARLGCRLPLPTGAWRTSAAGCAG